MALAPYPTLDDVKLRCKVELNDSSMDGLLGIMLSAAESIVQIFTGVPVALTSYTDIDHTEWTQPTATFGAPQSLLLTRRPVNTAQNQFPVVAAFDGTIVDPTTYTLDSVKGMLYATTGTYFGDGPYTITYQAGLAAHPEWATKYRALAGMAMLDICAWLYDQPNPGVKSEQAGGGVGITFDGSTLPPRTCRLLSMLPGGGVSAGL